ncbi:MAG TPA: plastocyanin/azurin family copper-binding protein [Actinomycetota bacterium]|nr:plastocyanin/azurin family copper-binding protein [Actinomycetota bacterium]
MRSTRFIRPVAGAAAAALVALAATSCVSSSDASGSSSGGSAFAFGTAGVADEATQKIEVETLDTMRFDPGEVSVSEGETVVFVVTNTGELPHELTIGDDAEQERHDEEMAEPGTTGHDHPSSVWLEPGETKEVAWQFGDAGSFLYGCHVPGHYQAGMVGTITVE